LEPSEAQELQEHAEHAEHDSSMRPVAFTMSMLAVLVAITTVLGHRTHTEAVLTQNKATDQWNYYQAHNIRATETNHALDELGAMMLANPAAAGAIKKAYANDQAKWISDLARWDKDLKEEQKSAQALEANVEKEEMRADRYDLAEALLDIGLVITSVTLLTRSRAYWFVGLAFALAGVISVAFGLMIK
jgi:Domain of unknown function (DUF4337)